MLYSKSNKVCAIFKEYLKCREAPSLELCPEVTPGSLRWIALKLPKGFVVGLPWLSQVLSLDPCPEVTPGTHRWIALKLPQGFAVGLP